MKGAAKTKRNEYEASINALHIEVNYVFALLPRMYSGYLYMSTVIVYLMGYVIKCK